MVAAANGKPKDDPLARMLVLTQPPSSYSLEVAVLSVEQKILGLMIWEIQEILKGLFKLRQPFRNATS